jgi:hypothetical protein
MAEFLFVCDAIFMLENYSDMAFRGIHRCFGFWLAAIIAGIVGVAGKFVFESSAGRALAKIAQDARMATELRSALKVA